MHAAPTMYRAPCFRDICSFEPISKPKASAPFVAPKGSSTYCGVGNGSAPTPVSDEIIEGIRGRESGDGYVELDEVGGLTRGDSVRIVEGAFCDQVGLFENVSDKRRVVILLELMGRAVRARIPSHHIERER